MPLPGRIGAADQTSGAGKVVPQAQQDQGVPVMVRCSRCNADGFVYFSGGFHIKTADKLMNRRPVRGDCGYCGAKGVELIPNPNLTPSDAKEHQHLYNVQETLNYMADHGIPIPKNGIIPPLAKLKEWITRNGGTP